MHFMEVEIINILKIIERFQKNLIILNQQSNQKQIMTGDCTRNDKDLKK